MGLICWLPLMGTLENKGVSNVTITGTNITSNTSGKIGSCYSFNGSSSYIKLDQSFVTNSTTEFSYACWVKFNSTASACLFSARTATNSNGISLFVNNSGNILYDIGNERRSKAYSFSTGIWYHITFTYKKGSYKKIYVNGTEIDSITSTGTMTSVSSVAFIGASQNANTTVNANYLNGYLNDIRIWNDHALSAAEVKEISQGLVLHYKLDDTVGFTDLISRGGSWTIYNNHNNTNMPSTLVDTGNSYNGDKIWRETCTPTDNSLNSIKTQLYSHGVYNWRRTFTANTKYVFWIYYKPISHPDTRCGGTASNIGGWTEIPPVEVGSGWYRVGAYRSGTVTTDKTDNIFVSFKVPSATVGNPIIIDWASPHLLEGTTEIPPYDYPSTIIQDSSGYGHNGTILNTVSISSDAPRYSCSTSLPNGNSMINCGRGGMVTDSITVNMWIKSSAWANPVSCTESGGWNFEASGDYFRFPIYISGVGYKYGRSITTKAQICNNQWHMLTGIYDRINQKVQIYVDGQLDNDYSAGTSNNIGYNGSNVIWIGAEATSSNTTASNGMAGLFSDFRIYCTALNADAIRQLYEVGAKVDNKQNLHTFELNENNKNKITKIGQLQCSAFSELNGMSYLKYDNQLYIEPDGSCWVRVYHHNNPGGGSFASTNDFAHSVYIDENRWFNVEVANYLDKWEIMVKGKFTSTSDEWKLRWIQQYNPMTATYADVAVANITKITTNGYSSSPSSWGGLYAKKGSAYLTTNNGNSGNWWGAVGSYSVYSGGIPGWGPTNTVTTTGFNDVYLRIDNVTFTTPTAKTTKNNIWTGAQIIEA